MRNCSLACLALALIFGAQPGTSAEDSTKEKASKEIDRLIRQLGDDDFDVREAASKELEKIGEPALAALQKARGSDDLEVRRRASRLVERISDRLARTDVKSVPPPKGAVVLFSGKNLDGWVGRDGRSKPAWTVEKGVMEADAADVRTRQAFATAYKLHVEFRIPAEPQALGNSGVYLHGNYEIQILDSYKAARAIDVKPTGVCGSIYGQQAPRVNASKSHGFWQSYDVEFSPPRFESGKKVEDAIVTVFHNGVLIHDKVKIPGPTGTDGLRGDLSKPAPVMLQYHGCPVQFRNLWLVPSSK